MYIYVYTYIRTAAGVESRPTRDALIHVKLSIKIINPDFELGNNYRLKLYNLICMCNMFPHNLYERK